MNAELARRKAEIAYKKENIYNQDKVRMTTDVRFFYECLILPMIMKCYTRQGRYQN